MAMPVNFLGKPKPRRVTFQRNHSLKYPNLGLRVYVELDPAEPKDAANYAFMFGRCGCQKADNVDDADLVVFSGGSDVDPILYDEPPHHSTYYDVNRDAKDVDLFLHCQEKGIPMLGICRGSQFLHTCMKGKLYQDVNGHYGGHSIYLKDEMTTLENASSVHHQMVIEDPTLGMEVLAWAYKSTYRWKNELTKNVENPHRDVEAFWYRDHCLIGFQGHPEYKGYNAYTIWCMKTLEKLIIHNPDIVFVNDRRRLDPAFLEMREIWTTGEIKDGA